MATVRLTGGSALRARLANVAAVPEDFTREWADQTVQKIQATKPHSERPASSKFTTKVTHLKAGVYGAFWWIFQDRGTKAHDIFGSGGKNPPDLLKFQFKGQTIFAKHVFVKRVRRRPFISRAAQSSLDRGADFIIKAWNGKRVKSHTRFL